MENIEVVSSGYGESGKKVETKSEYNSRVTAFSAALYRAVLTSNLINGNERTRLAISACIMYNDFTENNSYLMDCKDLKSEVNKVLFKVSKVDNTTGVIGQMDLSESIFDSIELFSSVFYGELHPENKLSNKICYAEKIKNSLK